MRFCIRRIRNRIDMRIKWDDETQNPSHKYFVPPQNPTTSIGDDYFEEAGQSIQGGSFVSRLGGCVSLCVWVLVFVCVFARMGLITGVFRFIFIIL